jgi:tRNA-specific 2-thiouridylase
MADLPWIHPDCAARQRIIFQRTFRVPIRDLRNENSSSHEWQRHSSQRNKRTGHELVGFTIRGTSDGINVDENGDPLPSRCCSLDDVYDARRVAEELGFPFYVLNLERDFERDVVQPFVNSYLSGETPIPCVSCNSRLKFASLDRLAVSLGCEKVATGHYARVEFDSATNRYKLLRGQNHQKDQSYFLWELTQSQLSRAMFPLGEMSKPEARDAARNHGLAVAEKKESQEICFVPDGDYAGFIDRYLEAESATDRLPGAGEIVDTAGRVIGEHGGIQRYTIGQRRGIGIAEARPLYVISLDADQNRVVVGNDEELLSREFTAAGINWVAFDDPVDEVRADVRVRYRHTAAPATLKPMANGRVHVMFDEAQRAITPGQATVFYRGEEVVGGGWIVKAHA